LDRAFEKYPIGVVQMELVQAVGGVRAIAEPVVHYLAEQRRRWNYLLFVDEVQTGMYRTGTFTMCKRYEIVPDLLTLGKGTTDMMFPFAVTLFSSEVGKRLQARSYGLARDLKSRADYEFGYRTLLNTLNRAQADDLGSKVKVSSALFAGGLSKALASCRAVRDIRVFGLLIGIELDNRLVFPKRLKKSLPFLYLLNMLVHPSFPVLIGYCQYEPHVLKLTPPLTISRQEIVQVCATIADVLNRSSYGLFPGALGLLTRTYVKEKWNHLFRRSSRHESAAC
jgi:4-aminobutyrate aminotransferase-like enzyme